jgi:hypothetical protein
MTKMGAMTELATSAPSFYPALAIGPNGALYYGGDGGLMTIRDTRWHLSPWDERGSEKQSFVQVRTAAYPEGSLSDGRTNVGYKRLGPRTGISANAYSPLLLPIVEALVSDRRRRYRRQPGAPPLAGRWADLGAAGDTVAGNRTDVSPPNEESGLEDQANRR